MLPKIHFLYGLFISIILFFIVPEKLIEILIFLASSVLVDFDHYIEFIIEKKSFGLKSAYRFFRDKSKKLKGVSRKNRSEYSTGIYIFHGIEPMLVAFLLGTIIHRYFFFVSAGMLYHHIFDWIEKVSSNTYPRKISLIYDIYKYRNCKKI